MASLILAVRYTSHSDAAGESLMQVTAGTFQGSRFGLRGNEELGGGTSAYFVLENTFSPDTGALGFGSRLFGRQAIAGVSGDFGSIQLGQDTTLGFDTLSAYDAVTPMNNNYQLQMPVILVGDRLDNSLKYKYQIGSLALGVQYAPGEVAGSNTTGSSAGANAILTIGAYTLAGMGEKMKDGNQVSASVLSIGLAYQGNTAKYAAGYVHRNTGANFNWVPTSSNVGIAGSDENLLNSNKASSRQDDLITLSMNYQLSIQWTAYSGYMVEKARNVATNSNGSRQTVYAIFDYALSKRTDIYLESDFNKSSGALITQPLFGNGIGNNQATMLGLSVGLRHKF